MIITFPMLVSQSVSENAIPGIAKTIEGYLIVNHMSDIMDNSEVHKHHRLKGFKTTRKGWFARESVDLTEDSTEDAKKRAMDPKTGTKDKAQKELEDMKKELADMKKELRDSERELDRANKRVDYLEKTSKDKKNDEERKSLEDIKNRRDELEKRYDYLEKKKRDAEKATRDAEKAAREKEKFEKEKQIEKERKATVKLKASDYKTISLEPSFVEIEITKPNGNMERAMVGIKVIPIRVLSPEKLSRLILHDMQIKFLSSLLIGFGRSILRFVYRQWDKWVARLTFRPHTNLSVSGDPRADIIMARVGGKSGLGIVVLNKNEDIDERFLSSMPRVKRLFRLGWGNIVVADDVSRQAYFCMRAFGGVCQVLSYASMYQTLGQLKVYESLEDAQRQNSSLFKISKNMNKVFSEWAVENKLLKYYISEDK